MKTLLLQGRERAVVVKAGGSLSYRAAVKCQKHIDCDSGLGRSQGLAMY